VRKVEKLHRAVNQRKAQGDEGVDGGGDEGIKKKLCEHYSNNRNSMGNSDNLKVLVLLINLLTSLFAQLKSA